jgi:FKBP-type peptidyl-prolyl cis-trans isomerase
MRTFQSIFIPSLLPVVVTAFYTTSITKTTHYLCSGAITSCPLSKKCQQEQSLVELANRQQEEDPSMTRRDMFRNSFIAAVATSTTSALWTTPASLAADENDQPLPKATTDSEGVIMYKTASGLKFIDLETPDENDNAKSPRYGQLCVIQYKAYLKLPNDKEKQKFDDCEAFVLKHGNGKLIPGLDEGLHTMKPGGKRRIIIPPKLGFVANGLGPMPELPWNRWKLNKLIDDMVTQQGGNLVYDVRLVRVLDDEADQGYYEDDSLTFEQFEELKSHLTIIKKKGEE